MTRTYSFPRTHAKGDALTSFKGMTKVLSVTRVGQAEQLTAVEPYAHFDATLKRHREARVSLDIAVEAIIGYCATEDARLPMHASGQYKLLQNICKMQGLVGLHRYAALGREKSVKLDKQDRLAAERVRLKKEAVDYDELVIHVVAIAVSIPIYVALFDLLEDDVLANPPGERDFEDLIKRTYIANGFMRDNTHARTPSTKAVQFAITHFPNLAKYLRDEYVEKENDGDSELLPDESRTVTAPVAESDLDTSSKSFESQVLLNLDLRQNQSPVEDIEEIYARNSGPTMKAAMVATRIGQGVFRERVLSLWDGRCCVTGVQMLAAIRASHIKPWRLCDDDSERLDPHNGLPLVATLDALFDAGLISFSRSGRLLSSDRLSKSECETLGIVGMKLLREPSDRTKEYLEFHNGNVFVDSRFIT